MTQPINGGTNAGEQQKQKNEERGKELHREFVGMLFALAIAEVAVQASAVVNSGLANSDCLPAYSHLMLAAVVIATSWVGWGWSKSGLTSIKSVFSPDFVELAMDIWLVAIYFFIAKGVELPQGIAGNLIITPSLANESFWIMVMFATYPLWDLWTKVITWKRDDNGRLVVCERDEHGRFSYIQRGWASIVCAILSWLAYRALSGIANVDLYDVLIGDASLLALVLLFRAMKAKSFSDMRKINWVLVVACGCLFAITLDGAAQVTGVGIWLRTLLP